MKKLALVALLVLVPLLVVAAGAGDAWAGWHGRVFIGVGPYWGPYPYWWYPPPYYYAPPPVVVQEPPVYIEQQPAPAVSAPAPAAEWYYCQSAREYYPRVQTCPEAWVRVPARPQ